MDQEVNQSMHLNNKIYLEMRISKEDILKQDVSQWLIKDQIQMEASFLLL